MNRPVEYREQSFLGHLRPSSFLLSVTFSYNFPFLPNLICVKSGFLYWFPFKWWKFEHSASTGVSRWKTARFHENALGTLYTESQPSPTRPTYIKCVNITLRSLHSLGTEAPLPNKYDTVRRPRLCEQIHLNCNSNKFVQPNAQDNRSNSLTGRQF